MVTVGEPAPTFAAPMATGGDAGSIEEFEFDGSNHDGPFVLAFYPAAFSGGCTDEMCAFRDRLGRFDDLAATVYGVSVDLPFALNAFIEAHDLGFPMISDSDRTVSDAYGVTMSEAILGIPAMAQRSVFVVDDDGTVAYEWVRTGDENPDFEALVAEVADVVEGL